MKKNTSSPRTDSPPTLCRRAMLGSLLLVATSFGAQSGHDGIFSRENMKEVDLNGLRVWLGKPVPVTAQIGWKMSWKHNSEDPDWSFIHLTPYMAKFPHGNLIVTYALDPDAHDTPMTLSGFQISKDGGAHWGRRYSVLMTHIPMIFMPKPHDTLFAISAELTPQSLGDEHNFVGPAYIFEHGGARMVLVPDGVRVLDWPWPDVPGIRNSGPQPPDNWPTQLRITGSCLEEGSRFLITAYGFKKGDGRDDTMLLGSDDGGSTWRFNSTIAGPDSPHASQEDYPSANEITVVRLADGDLMAVFRVEGGTSRNLRREYSHDGGRTWTKSDPLPAASVEPQVVRTAGGTIALSTGRPGLDLWLSTDPRARSWQKIDIAAHHNAWAPDPSMRIDTFQRLLPNGTKRTVWQTTAYTGLVEAAPNRLLLCYDRDPEQAPSGPSDLSRVFILPIEIERK